MLVSEIIKMFQGFLEEHGDGYEWDVEGYSNLGLLITRHRPLLPYEEAEIARLRASIAESLDETLHTRVKK